MQETTDKTELKEKPVGGYHIDAILLLESNFEMIGEFVRGVQVDNDIAIDSQSPETEVSDLFKVVLVLEFAARQQGEQFCRAKIRMQGIFTKHGEPVIPVDKFKKINAPAVIYPFVREHLHNLCGKAGMSQVLLPTVNFKL